MLDLDFDVLNAHPDWRQVLLAYRDTFDLTVTEGSETSELLAQGFRPRLKWVDGVEAGLLPRIHGQLIAHGLLQVEIAGRTGGMLYQLTTLGRQACLRLANVEDDAVAAD